MSNPEDTTPDGSNADGAPASDATAPDARTPAPESVPDAPETVPEAPEAPSAYATNDPAYGQGAPAPDSGAYAPPAYEPPPAYAPPPEYGQQPAGEPVDADAQPTQAYPPAFSEQPTAAYPPQPPYGQQPGYPAAYGQQPGVAYAAAPAPSTPDTRPKTLGLIALGLAIVGLVLVLVAFIPMLWVSLVLALVGGLLMLVAFVLSIVTLASKKQGGKGLGIGGLVVSVLGSGAWVGALIWSIVIIGLGTAGSSTGTDVSEPPAVEQSEGGSVVAGGEEAFLAEVRPQLVELFQEVEPGIGEVEITTAFSDETLISMGEGMLFADEVGRDAMVEMLSQSTDGLFSPEQAARFYDIIYNAAESHLAE